MSWANVLVVTPRKREANLIRATLDRAGIHASGFSTIADCVEAAARGVERAPNPNGRGLGTPDLVILAEEALDNGESLQPLLDVTASDPRDQAPFVVLARRQRVDGADSAAAIVRQRLARVQSVTMLERPLRPITLVSAVTAGLDLRRSQQEIQSHWRVRQEQERDLSDQREMLRIIADALPALICYIDQHERYQFNNAAYRTWYGVDPDSLRGRRIQEVWDAGKYRAVHSYVVAALQGQPQDFEMEVSFPAVGLRYVRGQYMPHVDAAGTVRGIFAMVTDLTQRRDAELALIESRQRFAAFMDHLPGAAWVKDLQGRYIYANVEAQRVFSRSLEALVGRTDQEIFDAETARQFRDNDLKVVQDDKPVQSIEVLRQSDGQEHRSIVSKFAIPGPDGRIAGVGGVAIDISDRIAAEHALRQSEQRYRSLIQSLPAAVYTCDAQGRILLYNQAAVELWGREPTIGEDHWCASWRLYEPDGTPLPPDQSPMAVTIREGHAVRGVEVIVERSDGTRRNILPYPDPIFDASGNTIGAVSMLLDVTERKHAEEELTRYHELLEQLVRERTAELERSHAQLRLSERMAALGTLSAGLGHDMGNLLLPVRLRLEAMQSKGVPGALQEDVEAIRKCTEYLQRLANGLRLFALDPEESGGQPHRTDMQDWWSDVETFLRNVLPRAVELERRFSVDLPPVALPRHRLTQAIFNLVQNAGNALRGRDAGRVVVWAERSLDRRVVRLGVSDNGPGMTPDVRARCLEPFYTTSTRSISTGLGLSLVHGIVTKSGGTITIESEPGRGTTFVLCLPAVDPGVRDQVEPARRAVVSRMDARMKSYVASLLRPLGYEISFDDTVNGDEVNLWVTVGDEASYSEAESFATGKPGRRAIVFGYKPDGRPVPQIVCFSRIPKPTVVRETLRLVSDEVVSELKDSLADGG